MKERCPVKILVIISSFRKKNTYNVVKEIERIHQSVSPCEYEYLFLKKADLKTCTGCHLCLTKGEQYCPFKDDRDTIITKIESADAVILASPNHTMNVNWLMKNYIDRLSYLMHRPRFFKQRFMLLITSGSYMGTKEALRALSPIVSGGKIISSLAVMTSPGMSDSKKRKAEKKVSAAALKFAVAMKKKYSFRATLANMLWFSVFKATTPLHADDFPADFGYYENKQFFVDTELNIFQKTTIGILTNIFQSLFKMGFV
jgi:multimeric flavodoxin WrbA